MPQTEKGGGGWERGGAGRRGGGVKIGVETPKSQPKATTKILALLL